MARAHPVTYTFDDVVAALNGVLEHDWAAFFRARVYETGTEPPLDGFARGGYRLVFKEERSEFQREAEAYQGNADFGYSLGLSFGENGNVTAVQWDGPAFNQGVTVGTQVVAVNGVSYSNESLRRAVTAAKTEADADRAAAAKRRSVSNRHDRVSRRACASAPRARHGGGRPLERDSYAAFTLTAARASARLAAVSSRGHSCADRHAANRPAADPRADGRRDGQAVPLALQAARRGLRRVGNDDARIRVCGARARA